MTLTKLQIGKNGLTEGFIAQAKKIFESQKVLRISILKAGTRDREEAKKIADELCAKLGQGYRYTIVGFVLIVRRGKK